MKSLKNIYPLELLLILILSSLFSMVLVGARVIYTEKIGFAFLVWNLFLAWIPMWITILLKYKKDTLKSPLVFWTLVGTWLLFFPNAPYILTDLFHLRARPEVPHWFDLGLILSFAWNGLMLAYISLLDIQQLLIQRYSARFAWTFVSFALIACAFGIYVGRYLRWNSWDILQNPLALFQDIVVRFIYPFQHPRTLGVTILFALFLGLGYLVLYYLVRAFQHTIYSTKELKIKN